MGSAVSLFLIGVGTLVALGVYAVTGAESTQRIGLLMVALGVLGLVVDRYIFARRRRTTT